MKETKHNGPSYEVRDARFRPLLYTGIGLLGLMALNLALSWGAYSFFGTVSANPGTMPETFTRPSTLPPGPLLQPNPGADMRAFRATEDSLLSGYAWVSKESGTVRVPVSRAMELLLKKGLPVRRQGSEQRQ